MVLLRAASFRRPVSPPPTARVAGPIGTRALQAAQAREGVRVSGPATADRYRGWHAFPTADGRRLVVHGTSGNSFVRDVNGRETTIQSAARDSAAIKALVDGMEPPRPTGPVLQPPPLPTAPVVPPSVPAPAPAPATLSPAVKNPELLAYLEANPSIRTVQQLVNATYKQGKFESTCRELGLNPAEVAKYRSANLMDWAVTPTLADGTMPRTPEEANQHFLTQYATDFNPYYTRGGVSTNCGPTSLAMGLRQLGQMPPGLNAEQQIDHARALMYPALAKTQGTTVLDANGAEVRLLDLDRTLTSMTAMSGATGNDAQRGWTELNEALEAGRPLVVEGNIGADWRKVFAGHQADAPGSYAGGGDGHFIAVLGRAADGRYLVADPMYSGGTVAMTRDELAVFFKKQGNEPSFTSVGA